jgi:hypothetical protein
MVSRTKLAGAFAALVAVAAGCNAVLGIDQASYDKNVGADSGGLSEAGGGTPDAGGDAGTPCDQYCTAIMTNCTGQNLEYIDYGTCVAMCKHFEPGLPSDTAQDSLSCRTYHANAAAGDPNFHCRHAGPLGGGVCGTDLCAPYCALDFALCQELTPYDGGESGCHTACTAASFNYLTVDAGDLEFPSGDTFNCRLYHLESAYAPNNDQARTTHCPHTAVVSAKCF